MLRRRSKRSLGEMRPYMRDCARLALLLLLAWSAGTDAFSASRGLRARGLHQTNHRLADIYRAQGLHHTNHRVADIYRLQKRDREYVMESGPPKRDSAFIIFSRFMTRPQPDPPVDDREVLVDQLFHLFDMNENGEIERSEFKAMLLLLGVIRNG